MRIFSLVLFIMLISVDFLTAQEFNQGKTSYPEGIYITKEDFIAKKPNSNFELIKKGIYDLNNIVVDDNEHACFLFEKSKDAKIRKAYAIVYHGSLYFKVGSIMKYCKKGDSSEYFPLENVFVKVIFEGQNYIYTEAVFANVWTKSAAMNGIPISNSKYYKLNNLKGVVWDLKNQEFDIFKDCADYDSFIKDKSPTEEQNCGKDIPNIELVRTAIQKVI